MEPLVQYAGAAVVGVVGTLGGLLLKNELDRRAERRAHRRKLIEGWRVAIDRTWPVAGGVISFAAVAPILETPDWMALRKHLAPSLRERLEDAVPEPGAQCAVVIIGGGSPLRNELLDAIDGLERRWGLV